MKTGVRGLIGLVLAGVLAMTGAPPAVADDVVIPDAALSACITRNLASAGLPADFTAENLAKLVKLGCGTDDGVIHDLTGLDELSGVTALNLRLDADLDLSSLESLPSLSALTLVIGAAAHVDLPTSLHLDSLWVTAREVPSTSTLVARSIIVSTNSTSLGGLGPLVAESVEIRGNQLADVTALAGSSIGGLRILAGPNLTLDGLGATSTLGTLVLSTLPASLAGLAGQETLRSLTLPAGPQLGLLKTLPELPSLLALDITSADLTALPDLSRLPALASLTVRAGTRFTTLGPPGSLKALKEIHVGYTGLGNIGALAGATQLRTVDLPGNRIASITALSALPADCNIDLSNNLITDISALSGIARGTLNLNSNQILDFSPLAGWTGAFSGVEQTVLLPDATIGEPFVPDRRLRGADGSDLLDLSGRLVSGALLYTSLGWMTSSFANAASESDATISVVIHQYVHAGAPFSSTPSPVLSGLMVGKTVTVTMPTWTPAPDRQSYQWWTYSEETGTSTAIPGATSLTFTPTASLAGSWVYLRIEGEHAGNSVVIYSNGAFIDYLPYVLTPRITLGRSAPVAPGTVLKASGTWDVGVKAVVHWTGSGADLAGSGLLYATSMADAGRDVCIQVTLSKPFYAPTTLADCVSVAYAQFANRTPTIAGTARVGHKLTARTAWPKAAVQTCKWYHYGVRIPGASECTYKVKKSDRGKRMRVLVKVSMPGYATMERWSRPKTVH